MRCNLLTPFTQCDNTGSRRVDLSFTAQNRTLGILAVVLGYGLTAASTVGLLVAQTAATSPQVVLPHPEQPFKGKIGHTVKDSTPDFPKGVEAPAGAPNVLLIMTDDVGFGATSRAGGTIHLSPAALALAPASWRLGVT